MDSNRIQVLSGPEQYTVASAWAFLQGLYPPVDVPGLIGGSPLAGGGGLEAPLNGYQYGRVETAGARDWNSIWIAGDERCPNHAITSASQVNSSTYINTTRDSASFYASTMPQVFKGVIPDLMVTYHNAVDLHEYAAYAMLHNSTVAAALPASSLTKLRALAAKRFFGLYGGARRETGNAEGGGDKEWEEWETFIKPIAGRTLAERVLFLLNLTATSSRPGVLNLLFGSSAPFVGFASVAGLAAQDGRFRDVPEAGSMMVFEVFSYTNPDDGVPGKEDLWVRFLYRNGTGEGRRLVGVPLFGRGRSRIDMRFGEFEEAMGGVGWGVGEWCEACAGESVFCPAFTEGVEKETEKEEVGEKKGKDGKEGKGEGGEKKKKGTTALELGLGLGAAVLVVVFGILAIYFCARRERKEGGARGGGGDEGDKEREGEEGGGSWEMGDRTPKKEERVRSTAYYGEDEDEEGSNLGEPVRVEDRI